MANRFRGEVEFAGESGDKYVVWFGSRALCQLMDEYDEPTDVALFSRLAIELSPEGQKGVNQRVLRRLLLACVVPPIEGVDLADQIIDDCGEMAIVEAFAAAVHRRHMRGAVGNGNGNGAGPNPSKPTRKKKEITSGESNSAVPPK